MLRLEIVSDFRIKELRRLRTGKNNGGKKKEKGNLTWEWGVCRKVIIKGKADYGCLKKWDEHKEVIVVEMMFCVISHKTSFLPQIYCLFKACHEFIFFRMKIHCVSLTIRLVYEGNKILHFNNHLLCSLFPC